MCAKTRQKVFKFGINEIVVISRWELKTVLMENNIDYSHQIITGGVFQHILSKMSPPPASATKKKTPRPHIPNFPYPDKHYFCLDPNSIFHRKNWI